jgi:hypothetical protein
LVARGIGSFGTGEFDDQLIGLDLNPDHIRTDQNCVLNFCSHVEMTPDGFDNEALDLVRRDTADGAGLFGPAQQQSR